MKIVLFFTYGSSLRSWDEAGLFEREVELYVKYVSRGLDVSFITYGNDEDYKYIDRLKGINILPIYSKRIITRNKVLRFFLSLLTPYFFSETLKQADLLKTNQIWGSWNAVISKYIYKKPLLVRLGWEPYMNAIAGDAVFYKKIYSYSASLFAYKAADLILCSSYNVKRFIELKYKKISNIRVLSNYIDTYKFRPMVSEKIADRILFVGRCSQEKNLEMLFEALDGTGYGVDIIGNCSHGEVKIYAGSYDVPVTLYGEINNSLLPEYYNKYDVFVLCSKYEGNPKALLEAMSCGCAVVGTNVVGINDIVADADNGVLCELNFKSLREGILNLMSDQLRRKALSSRSRLYVKKNNSIDGYVDCEYSIIRELYLNEKH